MTLDKLEEFLDDEYNMEFAEDKIFGNWITIEQELESLYDALNEKELADSHEEIKCLVKFLEKYKDKGLEMKYALDGIWNQGWLICEIKNDDYKFIDFYRTI